jgi:adenine-specific DNA-methyltransferase
MTAVSLGQYFTTNETLKEKLYSFICNTPSLILEPSVGRGDLVSFIQKKKDNIKFDMYEIDKEINFLADIDKEKIIFGDFLMQHINKKYKTIIGNPPYVKTKKGNLYIDFIEKCYKLLEEKGELIFIVPSDFFKLTKASDLLNNMIHTGTFTHIYHPHNEKLFENASIDVLVFRYCKDASLQKTAMYNDKTLHVSNVRGHISFIEKIEEYILFEDCFDIYVGIVSGKDSVYKNESLGTIEVINGENKIERYVYIDSYPDEDEEINTYLVKHKKTLLSRKIRKFNESNWFEWGALRNISAINNNIGKPCIYVHTLTRNIKVSFEGTVGYFGGGLLMLLPKKEFNLGKIVSYTNSDEFKKSFTFSGRFKIGHKQLSTTKLPKSLI